MNIEDVVERFSYSRPGYRLSDFSECGLPVFWLTVRALVLEKKNLPPIEEACLRVVDAGLPRPNDVSDFLGLSEVVISSVLGSLHADETVHYSHPVGEIEARLTLTTKGKQVLAEALTVRPEERVLQFAYDGLLCRPVAIDKNMLARPREAREAGWVEIPFLPARRPDLADLAVEDIDKIIHKASAGRSETRDLLAISSIETRDLMFMPAVMLVYRSNTNTDVQVSFVIDGRPFDDRAHAFTAKGGPKQLGIRGQRPQKQATVAKELALEDDPLPTIKATDDIHECLLTAQEELDNRRQAVAEAVDAPSRATAEAGVADAERNVTTARAALQQMTERWLYCSDHPPLLWRALRETTTRLLIISPWIRGSVVDAAFCEALELLLQKSVHVYIGYGLVENEKKEQKGKPPITADAKERLEKLQKKYQTLQMKLLGDTHAKILLCDNAFAIASSFNWLSFKGDPNKKFRDEQGYLVSDPSKVERKFQELIKRF